jgi:hypothetical protein
VLPALLEVPSLAVRVPSVTVMVLPSAVSMPQLTAGRQDVIRDRRKGSHCERC